MIKSTYYLKCVPHADALALRDKEVLGCFTLWNFQCTGEEERLLDCHSNASLPNLSCAETFYSTSVTCIVDNTRNAECVHGDYRLENGWAKGGSLEVCAYGQWAVVCIDNYYSLPPWTSASICTDLGFPTDSTC